MSQLAVEVREVGQAAGEGGGSSFTHNLLLNYRVG